MISVREYSVIVSSNASILCRAFDCVVHNVVIGV